MKLLFTELRTKLLTLTDFKFIDLDKGQLDVPDESGRYPVNYPCALINIELPRTQNLTLKGQQQDCEAIVNLRMAWDFNGNTVGQVTDSILNQSLEYFDTVQTLWVSLQGWQDDAKSWNQFERISQREETRIDGLKVINMTFRTMFTDKAPIFLAPTVFTYENNNQAELPGDLVDMSVNLDPAVGPYTFTLKAGDTIPDGVTVDLSSQSPDITIDNPPVGVHQFNIIGTGKGNYTEGQTIAAISIVSQELDDDTILTLSGTLDGANEYEVLLEGGQTIDCTLSGAPNPSTWVDTIGQDNAITTAFIAGIAGSESGSALSDALDHTNIERISDTVVRITLPTIYGYALDEDEDVSISLPAECFQNTEPTVKPDAVNSENSISVVTKELELEILLQKGVNEGYSLPSAETRFALNTLIEFLKDYGIWVKLDLLYVWATDGDSDFATLNLINPETFQCLKVNSPVFTILEGFKGDGSSALLDTGYKPSTNHINLQINSASYGGYVREPITLGSYILGSNKPTQSIIDMAFGNRTRIITDGAVLDAEGEGTGFLHANRRSENDVSFFVNSQEESDLIPAVNILPDRDFFFLARNLNGSAQSPSDAQLSVGFIGGDLSAESSDFFNAIETYMDAIGKGVVN